MGLNECAGLDMNEGAAQRRFFASVLPNLMIPVVSFVQRTTTRSFSDPPVNARGSGLVERSKRRNSR